jgi:hypothetical protein
MSDMKTKWTYSNQGFKEDTVLPVHPFFVFQISVFILRSQAQ